MTLADDGSSALTTGACAAAAAQAATTLLLTRNLPANVKVELTGDKRAVVSIDGGRLGPNIAAAAVVKKACGDRDVTAGVKIWAEVRPAASGVTFKAGSGVGVVTLPGLAAAVGEAAINPVPRRMIQNAVLEAGMPPTPGFEITISAEGGEELAKKTFNPKLGIVGGISILGTTGIVRPMSDISWRQSLLPQIELAIAAGYNRLVLTFGNLGENAALKNGFKARQIVQMSNFVGYMVDYSSERGITDILILGHLGKVIKIADGHVDTHSRNAAQRLEILQELAIINNISDALVKRITTAKSTEGVVSLLGPYGEPVFDGVATAAERVLNKLTSSMPSVAVAVTNLSGEIVGASSGARLILNNAENWR